MEKTGYHIYPTVPGSIYAFRSEARERIIKDVALSNTEVDRFGIAEMTLRATSVAAITDDNTEHTILRFQPQHSIKLQGTTTGKNLRTKRVNLAAGNYVKLRFYLDGKVSYASDTREERGIYGMEYIDFSFESPLQLEGYESPEFVFRFNFFPFKRKSWFKNFKQPKPIQWPTAKWA